MDRRFICRDCHIKWFIPASRPELDDLTECASCGGELEPLVPAREEAQPEAASRAAA